MDGEESQQLCICLAAVSDNCVIWRKKLPRRETKRSTKKLLIFLSLFFEGQGRENLLELLATVGL